MVDTGEGHSGLSQEAIKTSGGRAGKSGSGIPEQSAMILRFSFCNWKIILLVIYVASVETHKI